MGVCLFCRSEGKLTKEHVISDWISDHVPRLHRQTTHEITRNSRLLPDGGPTHSRRILPGDPQSRKLKIVCDVCNNGWMSRVVETAKPHVLPLLTGAWFAIGTKGCRAIATWAALAAMVWEQSDPEMAAITRSELDHMFAQQEPPTGWRVWIGISDHRLESRSNHRGLKLQDDGVISDKAEAQITCFTVGQLAFLAASSSDRVGLRAVQTDPRGPLVEIWPPRQTSAIRPAVMIAEGQWAGLVEGLTTALERML